MYLLLNGKDQRLAALGSAITRGDARESFDKATPFL
jgi:hypothetical protein